MRIWWSSRGWGCASGRRIIIGGVIVRVIMVVVIFMRVIDRVINEVIVSV